MRTKAKLSWFFYLIILFGLTAGSFFQTESRRFIQTPLPGEAVQGLVQVAGNTNVEGFTSYALEFSFGGDVTNTWFLIKQSQELVADGILGEWDTSVLSDGDYSLRLSISRSAEPQLIELVEGIRVRNYSPIETDVPTVTPTEASNTIPQVQTTNPPPTISPPPKLTPTPFNNNPAEIGPEQIYSSIRRGVVITAISLGIIGLYTFMRRRN